MSAVLTPPPAAAGTPPHTSAPAAWKWSRADYHRLGELGFFDGKRVQLIHGEIIVMSPMNSPHRTSVLLVEAALEAAFGPGFTVPTQLPLAFAESEPEPDAAVIRGGPRDYAAGHPTTALLVVEVSDTTQRYDLTTKAELYASAAIADYWVLDVVNRVLHVLRDPQPVTAGGHSYRSEAVLGPADTVAPLAAPGAAVRVADLLP